MKQIVTLIMVLFLTIQLWGQNRKAAELIFEGNEFNALGKYDLAIEKYKAALAIDHNSALANYELSYTYMTVQKFDEAILYSRRAIEQNSGSAEGAYFVLGHCLDVKGSTKDAILNYKKGLSVFPRSYLLNYSLALAEFAMGNYSKAEKPAIVAIRATPAHADGHLLLAKIEKAKKERIKALLPLYYSLLLEPDSDSSLTGYNLLKSLLNEGFAEQNKNDVTISITSSSLKDTVWASAEMMIDLLNATRYLDEKHPKSDMEYFTETNRSLFQYLGEIKKNNSNLWWDLYVTKFYDLVETNNYEAFSYYISQAAKSPEVQKWITNNPEKMKEFNEWREK